MVQSSLIIQTKSGPVQGFADTFPLRDTSAAQDAENGIDGGKKAVWKWLGIPYAKAGRWERPTAPDPWSDVFKAWEFSTKFPQGAGGGLYTRVSGALKREWITTSETSHTINIFAPEGTQEGDELPVVVYIYGGSLVNGATSLFFYDGTEWVRRSSLHGRRFILVTAEYRTNIFGFFSGPDVAAQDPDGLSGNYGLYDCVAFLEWVQANISKFGGSPNKVTCCGQSAGAVLVSHLLVTGKKLFQRAIIMSGAPETLNQAPAESAYAPYSGIMSTIPASCTTPAERIEYLRSLDTKTLLDLDFANSSYLGTGVTVEEGSKATWGQMTMKRLNEGMWDPWVKEVMLGTTEDEGTMFAEKLELYKPEKLQAYFSTLHPSIQEAARKKYDTASDPAPIDPKTDLIQCAGSRLMTDLLFVSPIWKLALALTQDRTALSATANSRVWMYRCRATVDRVASFGTKYGAMHGCEFPLMLNLLALWSDGDPEVKSSLAFGDRIFNFAATGNPDPHWNAFNQSAPYWLAIEHDGECKIESLRELSDRMIDFKPDSA